MSDNERTERTMRFDVTALLVESNQLRQDKAALESALTATKEQLAGAESELRSIDALIARRSALNKPTRLENIGHALNCAGKFKDELDTTKAALDSCCENETDIEKIAATVLGEKFVRGDTHAVPGAVACVEEMAKLVVGLKEQLEAVEREHAATIEQLGTACKIAVDKLTGAEQAREKAERELGDARADAKKYFSLWQGAKPQD